MHISARRPAFALVLVALALGATAPAFAHARSAPRGETADGGTVTYNAATGQYCIADTITGSYIAKVTCKTSDEWAAEGLTVARK